jgi:hypothetical protein
MRLAIGGLCAAPVLAVGGCGGKGDESVKPGPSFAEAVR